MIKKLDNLDFETIEKILNIWLNSNLEAHDFIKREYWIDNLDKVKKCSQIQQFTCIIDNQIVGFFDLYEQYIAGLLLQIITVIKV